MNPTKKKAAPTPKVDRYAKLSNTRLRGALRARDAELARLAAKVERVLAAAEQEIERAEHKVQLAQAQRQLAESNSSAAVIAKAREHFNDSLTTARELCERASEMRRAAIGGVTLASLSCHDNPELSAGAIPAMFPPLRDMAVNVEMLAKEMTARAMRAFEELREEVATEPTPEPARRG